MSKGLYRPHLSTTTIPRYVTLSSSKGSSKDLLVENISAVGNHPPRCRHLNQKRTDCPLLRSKG